MVLVHNKLTRKFVHYLISRQDTQGLYNWMKKTEIPSSDHVETVSALENLKMCHLLNYIRK
ncbi:hypothetical protein SAMN05443550_106152 [Pedobacter hartonius]|uniref:Uncharacterized protein n=1 Tax=Pedobacter hartonius TaxID=425514 RepID=A0A1H4EU35_9SPHI|nr:hypothetical protein SAMN05443550_106152 [Pedobacter hartonius]